MGNRSRSGGFDPLLDTGVVTGLGCTGDVGANGVESYRAAFR